MGVAKCSSDWRLGSQANCRGVGSVTGNCSHRWSMRYVSGNLKSGQFNDFGSCLFFCFSTAFVFGFPPPFWGLRIFSPKAVMRLPATRAHHSGTYLHLLGRMHDSCCRDDRSQCGERADPIPAGSACSARVLAKGGPSNPAMWSAHIRQPKPAPRPFWTSRSQRFSERAAPCGQAVRSFVPAGVLSLVIVDESIAGNEHVSIVCWELHPAQRR